MSDDAPRAIRILIAEDHPIVREGLVSVLERRPGLRVVGQAATGRDAVEMFRRERPDVTLLDLRMPEGGGLEALRAIREIDEGARVVVLTSFDTGEDVHGAFRAGARAYLLKDVSPDVLVETIRAVNAGQRRLPPELAERLLERLPGGEMTPRERELLGHLVDGLSNREIAEAMDLTEGTVKGYLTVVFEKMGVRDRTQAATAALRRGLVRR